MDISILIPTFNGRHLLDKTLSKLLEGAQSSYSFEIIVIDNGSHDDTLTFLKKEFPQVKTLHFQENKGFTAAINEGARNSKGRYLLVLNNDCLLKQKDLKKMYDYIEKNNHLVATQPIVFTPRKAVEQIGYVVDLVRGRARVMTDPQYHFSQWEKQKDIFQQKAFYGLSATCLLIKKDIFQEMNGFDESFHSYLEDVDLFVRIAKKGYQYAPCLGSSVIHEHMATSKKMGNYKEKRDMENWMRIIHKNYPWKFIIRYFIPLTLERFRNVSGLIKKTL